jgi:hypothetical protein
MSEECRLKVFENRVLRSTFGPKRDEVKGEWKSLYNEEMNVLYSSPNIIRVKKKIEKNTMGGECSTHGGEKRCIQGTGGET